MERFKSAMEIEREKGMQAGMQAGRQEGVKSIIFNMLKKKGRDLLYFRNDRNTRRRNQKAKKREVSSVYFFQFF